MEFYEKGIFISQRKCVLDLCEKRGKLRRRTLGIPIEQNPRIGSEESSLV